MSFDDLSMSAITALGHLRSHANSQGGSVIDAYLVVPYTTADRAAHDYERAVRLDAIVAASNRFDDLAPDVRSAISDLLAIERPGWQSVVQSGRDYVKAQLSPNVLQVFEAARLFDAEPSQDVVEWWDGLGAAGWSELDAAKLARGRNAERQSFEFEIRRLADAECQLRPTWVSIDDNQAGYDIASWDFDGESWMPLPIEVKSTVGRLPVFRLSRGEFDAAVKMTGQYRFHVWANRTELFIYERDQIISGAPSDGTSSRWKDAEFRP